MSSMVKRGLGNAEITIVDRPKYQRWAFGSYLLKGAEFGFDFGWSDVNERAAELMIDDSPVGLIARYGRPYWEYDMLADNTSSGRRSEFTAASLREAAGGKLKDAVVLAARSHSMLSPSETWETIAAMQPMSRMNFQENFERLRRMGRTFDVEHQPSVDVLNDMVAIIAEQTTRIRGAILPHIFADANPVQEHNSKAIDHIQAADFAAGWAVDLLISTNADYRQLARLFRTVLVNGIVLPE